MNNPHTTLRLLLVDDHTLVREALRTRLDAEIDLQVVGSVANADDAIRTAREHQPDIVIMDIDMPGRLSFDAARDICSERPETHLVFLSSFTHDRYIQDALKAKAIAYLTKDEPPATLISALRGAARGIAYFSPAVRKRLVIGKGARITLQGASDTPTRISTLTNRELEMLRYLARGMSKKEIAQTIGRSYNTVDSHCEKLMKKLDIHDRVELARFAIREGLAEA
ncbi:MAG: response regulator transcription factor [Algisphaera sp.]